MTDPDSVDERFAAINKRLDAGSTRMKKIESDLQANTVITQQIHDLIVTARAFFKVLGFLGSGMKWLGIIAAAAVSIWGAIQAFKSGGPPPK